MLWRVFWLEYFFNHWRYTNPKIFVTDHRILKCRTWLQWSHSTGLPRHAGLESWPVIIALESGRADIVHILRLVQACSGSRRSVSLLNLPLKLINMQQHKDQKRCEPRRNFLAGWESSVCVSSSKIKQLLMKFNVQRLETCSREIMHRVCLYVCQRYSLCFVVMQRRVSQRVHKDMLTDRLNAGSRSLQVDLNENELKPMAAWKEGTAHSHM